jgi:hypothetical protein
MRIKTIKLHRSDILVAIMGGACGTHGKEDILRIPSRSRSSFGNDCGFGRMETDFL